MRKIVFACLVLAVFLGVNIAYADKIEVNIKDKVVLEEKTITISDISTVTSDNIELTRKINKIKIGRTPWPNNHRRIDVDFLKMRLRSLNINLSDIVFNGADAAIVSVKATKITGAEIVQKSREYLQSILPLDDRETTIELERNPSDQWVPKERGEIDFDISLVDANKDRGNIGLIVGASSDGVPYFKVPVTFEVRVFEYVAVAKRKISRGQQLTKENVYLSRRETTKIGGLSFSSMDDLVGKSAIRSVLPNTIITEDAVEIPPAIQKGNVVKLFIKTNNFKIVTKGLAQQTGYKGDVIKVKNLDSKKMLYGKIIGPENVQIVF